MIPRKTLVIAHDLVMTAAAVVASFYIRFEAAGLMEREKPLLLFLPALSLMPGSFITCSISTRRSGGSHRCRI